MCSSSSFKFFFLLACVADLLPAELSLKWKKIIARGDQDLTKRHTELPVVSRIWLDLREADRISVF